MLGAQALLQAWEDGLDRSPTLRALGLLAAAAPDTPQDQHALLSIGARDTRLIELRGALFGEAVAAVAACDACREQLDVAFSVHDLLGGDPDRFGDVGSTPRTAVIDGRAVTFRVPTSSDLLAASAAGESADEALLNRCVVAVDGQEYATAVDRLPAEVVAELSRRMLAEDPRARLELELSCPSCGHSWRPLFDIVAFLWAEVDAWAQRTLRDVDTLARAYGWREADILAMSTRRRQGYLDLARS